jgi:hypothetical protein
MYPFVKIRYGVIFRCIIIPIVIFSSGHTRSQTLKNNSRLIPVDSGWARNSVNAVSFRRNAVVSWKDDQYISFYNQQQQVVVGKRKINSDKWYLVTTSYTGNAADAHNSISMMVDGEGYIHLAWDHHNNPLHYARSKSPGTFEFELVSMTGMNEESVTYPEFYRLKNGNLVFLYRAGQSGEGNLVMNEYDLKLKRWQRIHNNLIDGEGQRNAYWQACVDKKGTIHLSWVWRERPDVSSNHGLCYALSRDHGRTWKKLNGEKYTLPINSTSAEYARRIPQNSELINQTSMSADEKGNPFIVSYWRDATSTVPQYQLVYAARKKWLHYDLSIRKTPFSLSGIGTKRIPVARPQIVIKGKRKKTSVIMLFRDEERSNKVSMLQLTNIKNKEYTIVDLTATSTGSWEPVYDSELWREKNILHVFVQEVDQSDAEGLLNTKAKMVYVLECDVAPERAIK